MSKLQQTKAVTWSDGLTQKVAEEVALMQDQGMKLERISQRLGELSSMLDSVKLMENYDLKAHVPVQIAKNFENVKTISSGNTWHFAAQLWPDDSIRFATPVAVVRALPGIDWKYTEQESIIPMNEISCLHITPVMDYLIGTDEGKIMRTSGFSEADNELLYAFDNRVHSIQGLPNGDILCLVRDRPPYILNTRNGSWEAQSLDFGEYIVEIKVSGSLMVTGDIEGRVQVWKQSDEGSWIPKQLHKFDREVSSLDVTPNGKIVAAGGLFVLISDFDSIKGTRETKTYSFERVPPTCVKATFDGRVLIGYSTGKIDIRSMSSTGVLESEPLFEHAAAIDGIQVLPHGCLLSYDSQKIRIWKGEIVS